MTVTDIADEVQSQVLSAVQVVQDNVVGALEWITEQAETRLPEQVVRFTERLPQATHYVDRGFETAEQWLRSQRDFAAKVGDAVTVTAKPSGVKPGGGKTAAAKAAAPKTSAQ
jgi:hypothetical protein